MTIHKNAVHLVSLGCAKNLVDTEVMQGYLLQAGYWFTPKRHEAAIIIINTCAFIEEATRESIETILDLAGQKRAGKCRFLIVCGCLPQRYKDALPKQLPEVDLFLGTGEFPNIAHHIDELRQNGTGQKILTKKPAFLLNARTPRLLSTPRHTAYVKIAEGCSHHCTFCTIPKIKGPYKSRPVGSIVAEAKSLVAGGVREINLISQDTAQYGRDVYGKNKLPELLKKLISIPALKWVRLLYCHPLQVTDELTACIAGEEKICHYIDLPLQHISDHILKRMGRNITRKKIEQLLAKLRGKIPDITIRTTFIVGFPGETERDFEMLLHFVEEAAFDHVGVFQYHDEEGTPASTFRGKIPLRTKRERYHRIMTLQASIARKKNLSRVGQKAEVVIDGKSAKRGYALTGRTAFQAPEVDGVVYIKQGNAKPGDFATVRITNGLTYDLVGKLTRE